MYLSQNLAKVTGNKITYLHCVLASGTVYCNRYCLFVCVFVALWVCYHDNSKLFASIFTKLGL